MAVIIRYLILIYLFSKKNERLRFFVTKWLSPFKGADNNCKINYNKVVFELLNRSVRSYRRYRSLPVSDCRQAKSSGKCNSPSFDT